MFEIKYDRDGVPIRDKAQLAQLEAQTDNSPDETIQVASDEPIEDQETQEAEAVTQPDGGVTVDENPQYTTHEAGPSRPESAPQEDSDAKKSFRELSAAKKRAERERDEYLRRLEVLESRSAQQQQQATTPKEQVEEDEDFHLGADDIAEGKHISKVDKRAQNKIKALEDRLSKYEAKTAEERAEAALRSKYADFDKVVSRDNIDLLTEAYPELAQSLRSTNDLYTKAVSAYTLIKKFGIYQESPFNSEKAVALKNVAKPRPLASVSPQQGDTALSRANAFANGLTDDLKAQLQKEMNAARKGY